MDSIGSSSLLAIHDLLDSLSSSLFSSDKNAAIEHFLQYVKEFSPSFFSSDAQLLLFGHPSIGSMGLAQAAGQISWKSGRFKSWANAALGALAVLLDSDPGCLSPSLSFHCLSLLSSAPHSLSLLKLPRHADPAMRGHAQAAASIAKRLNINAIANGRVSSPSFHPASPSYASHSISVSSSRSALSKLSNFTLADQEHTQAEPVCLFGSSLSSIMSCGGFDVDYRVPSVLRLVCDYLVDSGSLSAGGLFDSEPAQEQVAKLKKAIEEGAGVDILGLYPPAVLLGLINEFFIHLCDPLIPRSLVDTLKALKRTNTDAHSTLLAKLDPLHFFTLNFFLEFLSFAHSLQSANLLTVSFLSVRYWRFIIDADKGDEEAAIQIVTALLTAHVKRFQANNNSVVNELPVLADEDALVTRQKQAFTRLSLSQPAFAAARRRTASECRGRGSELFTFTPPHPRLVSLVGCWLSSGGTFPNWPSWRANPQLSLELASPSALSDAIEWRVLLQLEVSNMRPVDELARSSCEAVAVGFYVVLNRGPVRSEKFLISPEDLVGRSEFAPAARVELEVKLLTRSRLRELYGSDPFVPAYLIIPSCFSPGWRGDFTVRADIVGTSRRSQPPPFLALKEAGERWPSQIIRAEWTDLFCGGGRPSDPLSSLAWLANPLFAFEAADAHRAGDDTVLIFGHHYSATPMGLYVFDCTGALVCDAGFSSGSSVGCSFAYQHACAPYWIMAAAAVAGHLEPFTLSVHSPFEQRPISDQSVINPLRDLIHKQSLLSTGSSVALADDGPPPAPVD